MADSESPGEDPPRDVALPLLDNVPEPLREALQQPGIPPQLLSLTATAFSASYSGPYPPAEQLRAYGEVLPNGAERLMAAFERQQQHRQYLEREMVLGGSRRAWWGLWLGFVIAVLVVGVGAGAIFTGEALAGFGIIIGEAAVLAGVFVYGRNDQRKERIAKDAQSQLPSPSDTGDGKSN